MKYILMFLFTFFSYSCSDKLAGERYKFVNNLLHHPEIIHKIIDTSIFKCDNGKTIWDSNLKKILKDHEFEFSFDMMGPIKFEGVIGNKSILENDNLHIIAYKNEINEEIFFIFKLLNEEWCLDTISNKLLNLFNFNNDK